MQKLPFKRNVILDGRKVTLYSIGWLGYMVKRHAQTVRKWEKMGILPKPIFEGQVDDVFRWYSAAELVGYSKIYGSIHMPSSIKDAKRVMDGLQKFKRKAHEFHSALKDIIMDDTKKLPAVLPGEADLSQAITSKQFDHVTVALKMTKHLKQYRQQETQ